MQVVVGIATAGRRDQLPLTLRQIKKLSPPPDKIVFAVPDPQDADEEALRAIEPNVEILIAERGLCSQRNAIVRHVADSDVLVFFDDDYYPAPNYIGLVREIMTRFPDVAAVTGHPRLDGARGPGVSHEDALLECEKPPEPVPDDFALNPTYGAYGCNMALRTKTLVANELFFDERLPLYGWLEDLELSRRAARFGRVVESRFLQGVHLGVKAGRQPGMRLGYSQIANPYYMVRKGSMEPKVALRFVSRNVAGNMLRSFRPEPWVDRRGRVLGNALAAYHLVQGRIDPMNVMTLKKTSPQSWRELVSLVRN